MTALPPPPPQQSIADDANGAHPPAIVGWEAAVVEQVMALYLDVGPADTARRTGLAYADVQAIARATGLEARAYARSVEEARASLDARRISSEARRLGLHETLILAVERAVQALDRVLMKKNASDADIVKAANAVLDRVNETAKVSKQEISGPDGGSITIKDDRVARLRDAIANDPERARAFDTFARHLHVVEDTGDAANDA